MNNISMVTKGSYLNNSDKDLPGVTRPGGGMNTKIWNMKRAVPELHTTSNYDEARLIALIEPLWFYDDYNWNTAEGDETDFDKRVRLIRESDRVNYLFAEEAEFTRWTGKQQADVLDAVDGFLVSNKYLQQQVKAFAPRKEPQILYTPIDSNLFVPREKKRQVVALSTVCVEKNIADVIKIFDALPKDIHKLYIGSATTWGEALPHGKQLEMKVANAADEWIESATHETVAERLGESAVYLNCSRYDVGCLSFLEAAMCGCWCVTDAHHPMFNEYPTTPFFSLQDAVDKIGVCVEADELGTLEVDFKLRKHVETKHGYHTFIEKLQELVLEAML